jgi:hypothetical protein
MFGAFLRSYFRRRLDLEGGLCATEGGTFKSGRSGRFSRYINVSMNFDNPEEYEAVIQLAFVRTCAA